MYYTLENKRISVNINTSDNDLNLTDEEYRSLMNNGGYLYDYELIGGKLVSTLNQELYKEHLRHRREFECFVVINRGELWYNNLTEEQVAEPDKWYKDWLKVTETKITPEKPTWVKYMVVYALQ